MERIFINKQDRQGVRTAADLEQRWKFGKTFAEFLGIAEKADADAQRAKEEVDEKVNALDQKLTQNEIFLRLTNNGKAQGLYLGPDGELYINASYVSAGVLSSQDGTLQIDLENGRMNIGNVFEFNSGGLAGYGVGKDGNIRQSLYIIPGHPNVGNVLGADKNGVASRILGIDSDLVLQASSYFLNGPVPAVRIGGNSSAKVYIKDMRVEWIPNTDGTYWLRGLNE